MMKKLLFIVVLVLTSCSLGGNTMKLSYPSEAHDMSSQTSFSCEAIMNAGIMGDNLDYVTDGIKGTLSKGTDQIALELKSDGTLSFLTRAAVEAGETDGTAFTILQNNSTELVAAFFDKNGLNSSMDVIAIEKATGLGVWTKTKPKFLVSGPSGIIMYLLCK